MLELISLLLPTLVRLSRKRHDLVLGNLLLRHQLHVPLRSRLRVPLIRVSRLNSALLRAPREAHSEPKLSIGGSYREQVRVLTVFKSGCGPVAAVPYTPELVTKWLQLPPIHWMRSRVTDVPAAVVDSSY
jgi:hypothetical protein